MNGFCRFAEMFDVFVTLAMVTLAFESINRILQSDHNKENYTISGKTYRIAMKTNN